MSPFTKLSPQRDGYRLYPSVYAVRMLDGKMLQEATEALSFAGSEIGVNPLADYQA